MAKRRAHARGRAAVAGQSGARDPGRAGARQAGTLPRQRDRSFRSAVEARARGHRRWLLGPARRKNARLQIPLGRGGVQPPAMEMAGGRRRCLCRAYFCRRVCRSTRRGRAGAVACGDRKCNCRRRAHRLEHRRRAAAKFRRRGTAALRRAGRDRTGGAAAVERGDAARRGRAGIRPRDRAKREQGERSIDARRRRAADRHHAAGAAIGARTGVRSALPRFSLRTPHSFGAAVRHASPGGETRERRAHGGGMLLALRCWHFRCPTSRSTRTSTTGSRSGSAPPSPRSPSFWRAARAVQS